MNNYTVDSCAKKAEDRLEKQCLQLGPAEYATTFIDSGRDKKHEFG